RGKAAQSAAPLSSCCIGYCSVKFSVWIVRTQRLIHSCIYNRCFRNIDGYLVAYRNTISVSGGDQGECNASCSDFTRRWSICCIENLIRWFKCSVSSSPYSTGCHRHSSVELSHRVVFANRYGSSSVYGRRRGDGNL